MLPVASMHKTMSTAYFSPLVAAGAWPGATSPADEPVSCSVMYASKASGGGHADGGSRRRSHQTRNRHVRREPRPGVDGAAVGNTAAVRPHQEETTCLDSSSVPSSS